MHGSTSFLDLTSSLARLVRPASWNLPASPIALGKARSGSVPPSPAREKNAEKNDPSFYGGAGEAPENERNESSAPRAGPAGLFARLYEWVRKKMAPRK